MSRMIEQMTLRVEIDLYNGPDCCEREHFNFFPDERLDDVKIGMRVGKNIFVSPQLFLSLISKQTFHETISGLLIKNND